jgi:GrpB-like predicted nucleotidyltransferase (UPF0157 family)
MTIASPPPDRIEIVPSDPRWPDAFASEAARIRAALAPHGDPAIEHVGSTAVPGLAAKPVIDILVIEPDVSRWPRFVEAIRGLGYVFWAENPRRDRLFFVKGMPPFGEGRTHHVHVRVPADSRAERVFRDRLHAHPDDAARYATLKRDLASAHADDREAYTAGKTAFIESILARR